jgi:DNA end-binding protein Ku
MLQTMLWPDEVRAAHFDVLDKDVEIRAQELSMAASLVESLAGDFDPDQYHDGYREQLLALIDAKVHGGHGVVAADEPSSTGGEVVDLLTALRESLARAGSAPAKKAPSRKAPAKKAAATKTPAKKVATKKAPAKKAPTAKRTPTKKAPVSKAPAKKAPAKKRARKTA